MKTVKSSERLKEEYVWKVREAIRDKGYVIVPGGYWDVEFKKKGFFKISVRLDYSRSKDQWYARGLNEEMAHEETHLIAVFENVLREIHGKKFRQVLRVL